MVWEAVAWWLFIGWGGALAYFGAPPPPGVTAQATLIRMSK